MAKEGNLEAPTRHPLDWQNPDLFLISVMDVGVASVCVDRSQPFLIWWTRAPLWK